MQINLTEYLDKASELYPDKVAFCNETEQMTFREMRKQAQSIAMTFTDHKREPVAILMKRTPRMIAAFFGVLYSGNFYVPLDKELSQPRIDAIINALKPCSVITEDNYYSLAATSIDTVILNRIMESALDTDPAYIVYTSGSTGMPKGVVANHRNVINYIEQLSAVLGVNEHTRFGSQTPLYVDACLKEVYTTVKCGASTVLIPKKLFSFPVPLIRFLNEYRINTICWVSSALSLVAGLGAFDVIKPETLQLVIFGSEVFPVKHLNLWREVIPDARYIQLYGPTEATGMSCWYEVDRKFRNDEKIPIGKAFRNTEVFLYGGELYIRGAGIASGYYNDLERTALSFVQNPLHSDYKEIVYKTGDLGEYNHYGELVYISRMDYQIKHMGYRIELGEIESAANQTEGVAVSCCVYDGAKLILFYVGNTEKLDLSTRLPRYMCPGAIYHLESMPLTVNGKIDRKKLEGMVK